VNELPKHIKKQLRELAGQAYENELAAELHKLAEHFDAWKAKKIAAGDLVNLIHKFHNGPARELFRWYNDPDVRAMVAAAVAHGVLDRESVPDDVWPYLESAIHLFQTD
jgi:hypothetical protein